MKTLMRKFLKKLMKKILGNIFRKLPQEIHGKIARSLEEILKDFLWKYPRECLQRPLWIFVSVSPEEIHVQISTETSEDDASGISNGNRGKISERFPEAVRVPV